MNQRRKRKCASREFPAQTQCFRPEEFPTGSAQSRAAARALVLQNQKRIQVIVSCPEQPLNLDTSECHRYRIPDGTEIVVLELDGNDAELSEAELEEFILRHPLSCEPERNSYEQLEA